MLTVHHLGVSQSERIVWLCEELGIPYELKRYDREPATRLAPAEYKALHPMGTAPIITDGDVVLAGVRRDHANTSSASTAMAGWRSEPDAPNFADYLFWFHFANASMMPQPDGGARRHGRRPGRQPARPVHARARPSAAWALVEERLGKRPISPARSSPPPTSSWSSA